MLSASLVEDRLFIISDVYLGQSKSIESGTFFAYRKLEKVFFYHKKIERLLLYFSMLFDHFHLTVLTRHDQTFAYLVIENGN